MKLRNKLALGAASLVLVTPAPAKLWKPSAPAIVRASSLQDVEKHKKASLLPGFGIPIVIADSAGPTPTYAATGATDNDSTTLPVPYYASPQANDIAFIWAVSSSTPTITMADGTWTGLAQINNTDLGVRLFWKRLAGGESGTVDVTTTGGFNGVGLMIGVRGAVTTGTPYEGANSANGSSTNQTSATIVTTGSNRLGIRFGGDTNSTATTPPATWTEQVDTTGGSSQDAQIDTKDLTSAGTEAASTRTISTAPWAVQTLAILPT